MSLTLFTLLLLGLLTNLICPFSASHILQPCFCLFPFCQPVPECCQPPCSMLVFCIFILIAFFSSSLIGFTQPLDPYFFFHRVFLLSLSLYVHLVIAQSHSQDPSICDASVEAIDEYWCYKYMFECVFASIYFLCIFSFHLFSLQWAIRHPSSFFPFLFLPPPFPCAYFLLPLSAFHRSFTGRRGSTSKK